MILSFKNKALCHHDHDTISKLNLLNKQKHNKFYL
jgi:hypothetical protein